MLIVHLGGGRAPKGASHELLEYVEIEQRDSRFTFVVSRNIDGVMSRIGTLEVSRTQLPKAVEWLYDILLTPRINAKNVSVICWCPENNPQLAMDILTSFRKDYVLVYENVEQNGVLARLDNSSAACFLADASLARLWEQQKYAQCTVVRPDGDLHSGVMKTTKGLNALPSFSSQMNRLNIEENRQNILLVSYFGLSQSLVSTQRLGYWSEELPKLSKISGEEVTVTWLSASRQAMGASNCLVIPDFDEAKNSRKPGAYVPGDFIRSSVNGFSWSDEVIDSFDSIDQRFDAVIVSVGPFGYLHLGEYFKDRWNCKTILDFRDPFGGDQRIGYKRENREEVNTYEQRAVERADSILSVNKYCLEAISPEIEVDRHVVPNGYDERLFGRLGAKFTSERESGDKRRFIYVGTIFPNLDLNNFVRALDPSRDKLVHYGRNLSEDDLGRYSSICELNGQIQDRIKLASELTASDVGVIRLGGEATTQTTKIFDYVGAGLEILVITDGDLYSGGVHEITKDLDGVHWVRNDVESIRQFLEVFQPSRVTRSNSDDLSRKSAALNLLEVIRNVDRGIAFELQSQGDDLDVEYGGLEGTPKQSSYESFEISEFQRNLSRIDATVDRISRGHLSNARSIQNLTKSIQDMEVLLKQVDDHMIQMNRKDERKFFTYRRNRKPNRDGKSRAKDIGLASRSLLPEVEPGSAKPEVRRLLNVLIICPAYPLHSRLYGGQFVQDRVAEYVSSGLQVTVFVPSNWSELIDVKGSHGERFIQGPIEQLGQRVRATAADVVCVHSVSPEVWSTLRAFQDIPKVFWFHGFEARPWLSLEFNYSQSEKEAVGPRLNALDTERKILLKEIFESDKSEVIFVSKFMKQTACHFAGVSPRSFHIIGNPLNQIFEFKRKAAWQRKKILSISSYSSRTYATDITCKAISKLLETDRNREFQITLVGSGRFFKEDTAQFVNDERVEVREAVLDREEMYELFSEYGVFLKPSRWDSQGLTTLEAMACGMVPVTSRVGGVPEFIDSTCGRFGNNGDAASFSQAIEEISSEAVLFESLSASSGLAGESYREGRNIDQEISVMSSLVLGTT